jgi:protein phosphatase
LPDVDITTYEGIRFIGDVHGDMAAFAQTVDLAKLKNLFVVQLGDLVDRGPDSLGCLRLAMELTRSGAGTFILGNHDDKLRRALAPDSNVTITRELETTLSALASVPAAETLRGEVGAALEAAPYWLRFGDYFAVHGGFDPAMLAYAHPDAAPNRKLAHKLVNRAIRGQAKDKQKGNDDVETEGKFPERLYDWIDQIPTGLTVLIGHDVVSYQDVVTRTGALGGRVMFCDTGCGKGGKLSWVDLSRSELNL